MPGQAPIAIKRGDLAGEYFERLRERFELAAEGVGGPLVQDVEMGGLSVRLSCAGTAIREVLVPPFEHLAATGAALPQLTISLFDTASTGVEAPPPAWQPLDAAPGTNPVARLRSDRACVLAAAAGGAVTAADPTAGEAILHVPDAARITTSERAAPLRDALQLLMAPRGLWMTHAGAVGRDGNGVLLVGRGGSGKSTLALSCALAGMEIVADDYVLLEAGAPAAHALQSTAKVTEDSAVRLGLDGDSIDRARFEPTLEGPAKALVAIPALAPGAMRRRLRIGGLIAPAIGGSAGPRLERVSAARGLRAVAPSTIVQSGSDGGASLAALAELVRRVPSYALRLGPEPGANAAAVDCLVGELG